MPVRQPYVRPTGQTGETDGRAQASITGTYNAHLVVDMSIRGRGLSEILDASKLGATS